MSDNLESTMRRIEKLLAIARDTRANTQEAAAAAAMAARIMHKYQIEEGDLILVKLKVGNDMGDGCVVPTLAEWKEPLLRIPRWAGQLAVAIAKLTDTKAAASHVKTDKGMEACVSFMGFKPDVALAGYTLKYLQNVIRALREDFKSSFTYKQQGIASLRAYTAGLSTGICEMIDEEIAAERASPDFAKGTMAFDLVVAKSKAVEEKYGPMQTKQTRFEGKASGFAAGVVDGKAVSINKAVDAPVVPDVPAIAAPVVVEPPPPVVPDVVPAPAKKALAKKVAAPARRVDDKKKAPRKSTTPATT